MAENTISKSNQIKIGSILGILSGIWGITVTILFLIPQIQMILPGTPMNIVLASDSAGLLFLVFHLVAFILLLIVSLSILISSNQRSYLAWLLIILSIIIIGVSLIPGSSIGFTILPGAVGMLISAWLILRSSKRIQV